MADRSNEPAIVTGLFKDRESAEKAYRSVSERGYDTSDINLAMSEDTRKRYFDNGETATTELGNKAAEVRVSGAPSAAPSAPLPPRWLQSVHRSLYPA